MTETPELKNAKIASTMFGIEDHGIMTYSLRLSYGSGAQGAGGYCLGGGEFGVEYLRKILETVGVMEWEQLPGKHVRVKATHSKVLAIGHIIDDKWMDLSQGVAKRG